jgi:hypothetical protein
MVAAAMVSGRENVGFLMRAGRIKSERIERIQIEVQN